VVDVESLAVPDEPPLGPLVLPPPPDELPPPLLKERPRPLRLPRICGAMMEANFKAWMVPLIRIVRRTSPSVMPAVRVAATVFCAAGCADWILQ
jgi:hypothetical protein